MPLYEYRCDACGKRFELIQKFSDPAPDACKLCGKGPVLRQFSSPAIQFKGSGFYITDYAKKTSSEAGSPGKSGDAKNDKSEQGEKSETSSKSETGSGTGGDSAATTSSDSSTKKESTSKSDASGGASTTSSPPAKN